MITIKRLAAVEDFPRVPVISANFDERFLPSLFGPDDVAWYVENNGPLAVFGLAHASKLGLSYVWIALFRKPSRTELSSVFDVLEKLKGVVGRLSALVMRQNERAVRFSLFCGFKPAQEIQPGLLLMELK